MMYNYHILQTIIYLRCERGELLGTLLRRFGVDDVIAALGVINLARILGVYDE